MYFMIRKISIFLLLILKVTSIAKTTKIDTCAVQNICISTGAH